MTMNVHITRRPGCAIVCMQPTEVTKRSFFTSSWRLEQQDEDFKVAIQFGFIVHMDAIKAGRLLVYCILQLAVCTTARLHTYIV